MSIPKVKIIGTGSYLPQKILTNQDLEKMVDTSDEWIVTRTGIRERRIADPQEASSDLAIKASEKALSNAKIDPRDIDLIIVATVTPDMLFPSTACIVQEKIGATKAFAFDLNAACTGFIYGIACADQLLKSGKYGIALVIATETLSRITDWEDKNTCVLFGDGAGCVLLKRDEGNESGIISYYLGSDGKHGNLLYMPGGGSRMPATSDTVKGREHFLKMSGNEVFKIAVQMMVESANKALEQCGLACKDVKLVIPHQANVRIINIMAKRLGLNNEQIFLNIHKYGNISAATTAVALDEAFMEGKLKKGDIVELVAFGAGFTWGACVIRC